MQELGLQDAAIINAWVALPEEEPSEAEEGQAEMRPEDAAPVFAIPSLDRRTYPRTRANLSPDDLRLAARVHEDNDLSFDMQGEYLPNGMEASAWSLKATGT